MNRLIASIMAGLLLSWASLPVMAQEGLWSLRGGTEISEDSVPPQSSKWMHDSDPIMRQYVQQPPLVPHRVEGYRINKKFNKCLTCHSWSNYKTSGATKISPTHFVDHQGVEGDNVAGRRYFCLQCHVPQRQVQPIVGNSFQPIKLLDRN